MAARRHIGRWGRAHPLFGDGTLAGALRLWPELAGRPLPEPAFDDLLYCRAFALACRVWCEDLGDPAYGATRYHSHRVHPAWTAGHQPVALIGRYFFYNDIP